MSAGYGAQINDVVRCWDMEAEQVVKGRVTDQDDAGTYLFVTCVDGVVAEYPALALDWSDLTGEWWDPDIPASRRPLDTEQSDPSDEPHDSGAIRGWEHP